MHDNNVRYCPNCGIWLPPNETGSTLDWHYAGYCVEENENKEDED
jgi:hypothetical protein